MTWSLGIHGGVNTRRRFRGPTPKNWLHDAAAVLCRDGEIVAAAEEERFVRIKHVNDFPMEAVRFCLQQAGISLGEVRSIGLSSRHMQEFHHLVNDWEMGTLSSFAPDYLAYVRTLLEEEFGAVPAARIFYVGHHLSHTLSAVCVSGLADCLCVVLDGWGDELTGKVSVVTEGRLTELRDYTNLGPASLYLKCTQLLGYDQFDEYKVMGLAPYGDPERFRRLFEESVHLEDDGQFSIAPVPVAGIPGLPRKRGEPMSEVHADFAAALQAATERVLFHVLRHFRQQTGCTALCLAGGVAQNCTANGRILASGLFERVFVQPVAYDAGCALGAALYGQLETSRAIEVGGVAPLEHLYHGLDVGTDASIAAVLHRWRDVIDHEKVKCPAAVAGSLLAEGKVIGWVQGRAELGARALGNRSILADPRPRENRDRINAMVKKREGYRPFAPSVLEERLHDYFDVPASVPALPYMAMVVPVREKHRKALGAITHVDGTARVQTVSREVNPLYWELIDHFRSLTGVPMVLNTSFNNNVEPIVNSCEDALNCFLSTGLDHLIVGDYLVRKGAGVTGRVFRHMTPRLNPRYLLATSGAHCQVVDRYTGKNRDLSRAAFDLLDAALRQSVPLLSEGSPAAEELAGLWQDRVIWF